MEFFNNTHTLEALTKAWSDRKVALRKAEDQEFCDMLFKSIWQSVQVHREDIYEHLQDCIATATHETHLHVPIWQYWEGRFKHFSPDYHEKMAVLRERGDDWSIFNADRTKERRVVTVMRQSDICARLATMFGHNFVVCDVACEVGEDYGECKSIRHEIRLYFYPNQWKRNAPTWRKHQLALAKYVGVPLREEEPLLYNGGNILTAEQQQEMRRVLLDY